MPKPKVSVLVTFYNQEEYVDKALESIISQKTDFGIKILVGDDGSSDGTCDAVNKWIAKYPGTIALHVMDHNDGPKVGGFRASRNRLNLLKYVDTEYFIYLDGDDYFDYSGKLQRQVEILDDPANSDCIACGHNINMLYSDGGLKPAMSYPLPEGKIALNYYWRKYYIHTDTLLIRSSVIPTFDIELLENHFNDIVITYNILQAGKIYYIPELWAVYAQTGNGVWTSGHEIVNAVRSMMMFDICLIINPKISSESKVRFSNIWKSLMKNRKSIAAADLKVFSDEALKHNLKYTYQWIHYPELSFVDKIKLLAMFISVRFNRLFARIFYGV